MADRLGPDGLGQDRLNPECRDKRHDDCLSVLGCECGCHPDRNARWARWPWQRCPAVQVDRDEGTVSCGLRRGHDGAHLEERGMHMVSWPVGTRMEPPHGSVVWHK